MERDPPDAVMAHLNGKGSQDEGGGIPQWKGISLTLSRAEEGGTSMERDPSTLPAGCNPKLRDSGRDRARGCSSQAARKMRK